MSCYACGRDAIHRGPRCAKPYCDQHGSELCAACQDPSSAIPSGALFRGALLALLVASVLALWLLIRPPGADDESGAQGGPPAGVPSPTPEPSPFEEYTVQQGDSLSSIAQQFGTTADELARINSITDPNSLSVGQKLQVPRPTSPSP